MPPRVLKDPPRIDHGASVAQRLQRVRFPRLHHRQRVLVEVDDDLLPRRQLVADPDAVGELRWVELPRRDAVAEEDARVRLGDDDASARGAHGNGGVLPRGTAPKVVSADDDGVLRLHLPLGDEPCRVEVLGEADEGVGAELLVFVGLGRDEGEVLGRDDLVGVDVLMNFLLLF